MLNKLNIFDIGGEVIKDNEVYKLKDNTTLNNLVVSSTEMKPHQTTNGHKHRWTRRSLLLCQRYRNYVLRYCS